MPSIRLHLTPRPLAVLWAFSWPRLDCYQKKRKGWGKILPGITIFTCIAKERRIAGIRPFLDKWHALCELYGWRVKQRRIYESGSYQELVPVTVVLVRSRCILSGCLFTTYGGISFHRSGPKCISNFVGHDFLFSLKEGDETGTLHSPNNSEDSVTKV